MATRKGPPKVRPRDVSYHKTTEAKGPDLECQVHRHSQRDTLAVEAHEDVKSSRRTEA